MSYFEEHGGPSIEKHNVFGFKAVSRAAYQKAPGAAEGVSKSIKVERFDTGLLGVSKRIKTFDTFFDTAFGPDGMDGNDASR